MLIQKLEHDEDGEENNVSLIFAINFHFLELFMNNCSVYWLASADWGEFITIRSIESFTLATTFSR